MSNSLIEKAMDQLKLLEFSYHGCLRVVEPHVLGVSNGVTQILGYQTGGSSSSGRLPDWRRFDLHEMSGLRLSERTFAGRRPARERPGKRWDWQIKVVE